MKVQQAAAGVKKRLAPLKQRACHFQGATGPFLPSPHLEVTEIEYMQLFGRGEKRTSMGQAKQCSVNSSTDVWHAFRIKARLMGKLRKQATTRVTVSRGIHLSPRGSRISLAPEPSKNLFRKRSTVLDRGFARSYNPRPFAPMRRKGGPDVRFLTGHEQRLRSPKGRHPGFADCTFLLAIDTRLIT